MTLIEERIEESISIKQKILRSECLIHKIMQAAELICKCYADGGKVLLCGNGGSASDALHIAGELIGRFQKERKSLPAVALNADVAAMTAIANDYGYNSLFERQVEGLFNSGDVLIGISTSGNSENIYRAIERANDMGGHTIALLGKNGGKIKDISGCSIVVPSDCTARIQESHIMIGHIIVEQVENIMPFCDENY